MPMQSIEIRGFFILFEIETENQMKKLIAVALIALAFTACEKKDTDQHCWVCENTKSVTDDKDITTTTSETETKCAMTADDISVYEKRYAARKLLKVTYGDKKCKQIEDTLGQK
jgi:hypothetical protein